MVSPNSLRLHLSRINSFCIVKDWTESVWELLLEEWHEKAVAIVAGLPPAQSTSQPLATLGSLYQLKGDTLTNQQSEQLSSFRTGMATTVGVAPRMVRQGMETFAKADALDRLVHEAQMRRALEQGVAKERIRFGGSSFLYSHLGDLYRHLGRFDEALQTFQYLSAIVPMNAAGCMNRLRRFRRQWGRSKVRL